MKHSPLGPGIHDISAERYHADPCERPSLSNSIGKLLLEKSPAHAWTASPLLNPNWEPTDSPTFDVGRAAHAVILGKGLGYKVCPEAYLASNSAMTTKAAKEWVQDIRAEGFTPLKQEQADAIDAMAVVMRKALIDLRIVLDPEHSEKVAIAEIEGVMCRAMVDNVPTAEIPGLGLVMLDLKTTETATHPACQRSMMNYGYDFQDEHYSQTWKAATGEARRMLFLFQEKKAPFEVNAIMPMKNAGHSGDWGAVASRKVHEARRKWKHCVDRDDWPGYPRLISEVGAPPYYAAGYEDAESTKASAEALISARKAQEPQRMTQ